MKTAICIAVILLMKVSCLYAEKAQIAVASNFTDTAQILAEEFHKQHPQHQIGFSFASSGKLYAQIVNGAPFDAFLAADQHYINQLAENDLIVEATQFGYALGQLVLFSNKADYVFEENIAETVKKLGKQKLAIAQIEHAPYGLAAKQSLEHIDMWETVQNNLVYGENINQTYQFVITQHAALGFISLSQALQAQGAYINIPADFYEVIKQDAVLLIKGKNNSAARMFLDFLKSEQAVQIINRHGYKTLN